MVNIFLIVVECSCQSAGVAWKDVTVKCRDGKNIELSEPYQT